MVKSTVFVKNVLFIKKVRCEFCNKDLNKSYLRSHVKKQHIKNQHYNQNDKRAGVFSASRTASHNDEAQENSQLPTIINTGGDLLPTQLLTKLNDDDNNNDNIECNRTLIVSQYFCGKTILNHIKPY